MEVRYHVDPETGQPHIYGHGVSEQEVEEVLRGRGEDLRALARRSLTGPALHGDYVVVGDYKGYVHWLQASDGAMAARAKSGGDALLAQPVVADGVLLVQNVDGKLTAFRLAN